MAAASKTSRGLHLFIALHCLAVSGSFVAAILVASHFAAHPDVSQSGMAQTEEARGLTPSRPRDAPAANPLQGGSIPKWARAEDLPPRWSANE